MHRHAVRRRAPPSPVPLGRGSRRLHSEKRDLGVARGSGFPPARRPSAAGQAGTVLAVGRSRTLKWRCRRAIARRTWRGLASAHLHRGADRRTRRHGLRRTAAGHPRGPAPAARPVGGRRNGGVDGQNSGVARGGDGRGTRRPASSLTPGRGDGRQDPGAGEQSHRVPPRSAWAELCASWSDGRSARPHRRGAPQGDTNGRLDAPLPMEARRVP